MKKSLLNLTVMAFLATASSAALATDVTIPNTFTSGTAAVAAEVNDNFTAVKTAVDDNDGRITANATAITTKANSADVTADIAAAVAPKADTTAVTANSDAIALKANSADVTAAIAAAVAPKANTTAVTANSDAIALKADTSTVNTALDLKADTSTVTANDADITALQQNGNPTGVACAGNDVNDIMVRVGPLCVDKYEASVWSTSDGSTSGLQLGDGADNYSAGTVASIVCSNTGNDCTAAHTIYARSEASVNPSTDITWYQAQQACAASGKRLLTNAEWQMAAAGTSDPGAGGLGSTACNTNTGGILTTGDSGANCESNWGTADMVGNVWEWVADWIQGNGDLGAWLPASGDAGSDYGSDAASGANEADAQGTNSTNQIAAITRGGRHSGNSGLAAGVFALTASSAPSVSDPDIGFRCAR